MPRLEQIRLSFATYGVWWDEKKCIGREHRRGARLHGVLRRNRHDKKPLEKARKGIRKRIRKYHGDLAEVFQLM